MKLSFACLVPFHFQRAKKDPSWPTVAFGAVGVGKFKKTRLLPPPFYARRAFNLVHGLLCVASSSETEQQSKEKRIVEQIERDPLVLPPPTGRIGLVGRKRVWHFKMVIAWMLTMGRTTTTRTRTRRRMMTTTTAKRNPVATGAGLLLFRLGLLAVLVNGKSSF